MNFCLHTFPALLRIYVPLMQDGARIVSVPDFTQQLLIVTWTVAETIISSRIGHCVTEPDFFL